MNTYILYHASCYDGFGAAWAAWRKFGDDAKYIPVHYGKPMPELPDGSDVFIVDFSYPRQELLALKARMNSLVVLDHHKTAQQDLAGLDFAIFDMDKPGAVLAWKYFHPAKPVPKLLEYVQDRDLWRWNLAQSREFSAALQSYKMDFELWENMMNKTLSLIDEGEAILRWQQQKIDVAVNHARLIDIAGYQVPVINATQLMSEICHALCDKYPDAPFSAYYFDDKDGNRQWGLRSVGEFDVSAVAKLFGGGGHRNAAGFQTPSPDSNLDGWLHSQWASKQFQGGK